MMEFLRQGGYAFFVWGAFGVTFALLVAEVVQLRSSRRTILARVGRLSRLRASNAGVHAGEHKNMPRGGRS
jgi:heme exporter protein D